MYKEVRYIDREFHIDTNRINSRSNLPAMNSLEHWHKNGVISIEFSEVARKEALFGGDYLRTKKANTYIFTKTLASTAEEQKWLSTIKQILFLKEEINSNKRNDIEIVFNAKKYGAILITNDGASKRNNGILDHKNELKQALNIDVMTDEEAVDFVRELINERDKRAIILHKKYDIELPEWVGKD
jgi:hypothetical protein